ncbi:hypothetical protein B0H19DRAFT_1080495 [Mycena capillaripes]|nr:hypothetical protein B0H19DRAFT_1080495 [Mycena capillaripes]
MDIAPAARAIWGSGTVGGSGAIGGSGRVSALQAWMLTYKARAIAIGGRLGHDVKEPFSGRAMRGSGHNVKEPVSGRRDLELAFAKTPLERGVRIDEIKEKFKRGVRVDEIKEKFESEGLVSARSSPRCRSARNSGASYTLGDTLPSLPVPSELSALLIFLELNFRL